MNLQCFGAARSVTGSRHLITIGKENILLDCGLFQGKRQEYFDRNREFGFDPSGVTAVVLSHAHIDHSGNIPQLIKKGYKGNIYCTHATQDLTDLMLRDSAHVQEKDTEFVNKKHAEKGLPPVEPIYKLSDIDETARHLVGIGYHKTFKITPHVEVTFLDAGHILGSAVVVLDMKIGRRPFRITFTGDLGRSHMPVIRDPEWTGDTDVYITESTYGNRFHDNILQMKPVLKKVIERTVERKGKIIVPAFSLGRTQELVHVLHQLFKERELPEIPIFVDSPLSLNVTEIFRMHPECFDEETQRMFITQNEDPFGFYRLNYIRDPEASKKLNAYEKPCMIISASGMCEAGRILHHLAHTIGNPRNTILVVGFMAENTLGRRIVERHPQVNIFGEPFNLRAEVVVMEEFSSHADRDELLAYFEKIKNDRLKHVVVVHGETEQSESLAAEIQKRGIERVSIPFPGEVIEL